MTLSESSIPVTVSTTSGGGGKGNGAKNGGIPVTWDIIQFLQAVGGKSGLPANKDDNGLRTLAREMKKPVGFVPSIQSLRPVVRKVKQDVPYKAVGKNILVRA